MNRLDFKNKFSNLIRDDEKVLWTGSVNKKAYMWVQLRYLFIMGLFPLFLPFMLLALTIFLPLTIYLINKASSNTFFCITDKQIIKRFGIIKNDYSRYSLSSISEIRFITTIFDSQEPQMSSTLRLYSKYLGNINGSQQNQMQIQCLLYADEAYKILSKLVDNEGLNIKVN